MEPRPHDTPFRDLLVVQVRPGHVARLAHVPDDPVVANLFAQGDGDGAQVGIEREVQLRRIPFGCGSFEVVVMWCLGWG